jgi:hypothetical protein
MSSGNKPSAKQKTAPPSEETAKKWIEEWCEHDGSVCLSIHLKRDRAYRNITFRDCKHVLKTGELQYPPEWDKKYENWVFKKHGFDLDGDPLTVVFRFDPPNVRIVIITGE